MSGKTTLARSESKFNRSRHGMHGTQFTLFADSETLEAFIRDYYNPETLHAVEKPTKPINAPIAQKSLLYAGHFSDQKFRRPPAGGL